MHFEATRRRKVIEIKSSCPLLLYSTQKRLIFPDYTAKLQEMTTLLVEEVIGVDDGEGRVHDTDEALSLSLGLCRCEDALWLPRHLEDQQVHLLAERQRSGV